MNAITLFFVKKSMVQQRELTPNSYMLKWYNKRLLAYVASTPFLNLHIHRYTAQIKPKKYLKCTITVVTTEGKRWKT